MKTKVLPKSIFEGVNEPQFEDNWDFCLVTPISDNLEMTYFNIDEINLIILKYTSNELHVDPQKSIIFCLTPRSELTLPDLGCFIAMNKK